jgi:Na+-driven multidrug efflux pump
VGAAKATVISRLLEAVIIVTVSYAKKYAPAGKLGELFGFNRSYARRFFRIALPVIFNEIVWSSGITTQNIIFARTGTSAFAAFNITGTVSMLTWVFFLGLGHGVAVLIGKKIGEGDEKTARDYAARITRFSPLLAVGAVLVLFPLSLLLPFVFNVDKETLHAASQMFIVLCCVYPLRAFNMSMIIGVCRAGGDTIFCMIYDVAVLWLVNLPLAAIASFVFHVPVWLIFLCICLEEPLKVILGLLRLKSGKWLHNVTENLNDAQLM